MIEVEGGAKFNGLVPLIEHHMKNPMLDRSMSVLNLGHPFHTTSFFPANASQQISELQKPNPDVYGKTGFWEKFEVGGNAWR